MVDEHNKQPEETNKTRLIALAVAINSAKGVHFVSKEENEAKVNSVLKDAQKLLEALREKGKLTLVGKETEPELVLPVEQSFGMGPRKAINANITPDEQRQIDLATEQFKQSVQRVDNQLLALYVQAVQNGDYAEAERILEQAQDSQQTNTLMFALMTIGAILLPLYAKQRIINLFQKFGLNTVFALTTSGEKAMKQQAEKGAKSHIRTICRDLMASLDKAIDSEIPAVEATVKDKYEELAPLDGDKFVKAVKKDENIYKFARDAILAGDSRQAVIVKLQENFSEVGKRRANVIAANEANRVFTMSQYDADLQFLAQNKLTGKAYKRLVSNTGTPEAICKYIIDKTAKNPIPFKQDFAKFGVEMQVKDDNGKIKKFTPNYEHLKSGHIHVNCHCRYELIIKQDDGTFLNTFTWKVENDFDEKEHVRWPKGTPKGGKFMKQSDVEVSAENIKLGVKFKADVEAAQEKVDWANSGFGDLEEAQFELEAAHTAMSKLYRKHFEDNGLKIEHYAQLKREQYDYSGGGGERGKDGAYIVEPPIQKTTPAQIVHSSLTQAILAEDGTHMNLHRGQNPDFGAEPTGIVSYTDSKAIASSFGISTQTKMTDVKDILYHYQLDFSSVHPSEQEVIVKQ